MNITNSNTARAVTIIAAAALLNACGGAKEDTTQTTIPSSTGQVRLGSDPEGGAILLTALETEALTLSQAEQDAAFNKNAVGEAAFKSDAVANQIRFVADFDNDGKDDILWHTTTGATHISFMNGAAVGRCAALGVQADTIMGTGDFNGDGKADIVWRNMSTGAVRISLMDGGTVTSWLNVGASPIALSVKLEAVGDFDGNGRADMLWRNQSTGRSVMSYHDADGSVLQWPLVSNFIALNTSALKVGDINGDGKDDIVWRNMGSGNVVISLMNGNVATWRGITASPIPLSVALEAVGDFDNNGRADLLWRNTRTGNSLMSYHNEDGSVASWPVVSNYINPTSTSAQGVGDFDGGGKDDILWRNLGNGNTVISIMNGNVPTWAEVNFSTCPVVEPPPVVDPPPVVVTPLVLQKRPHSGVTAQQCYREGSNVLVACDTSEATSLNSDQDGHRIAVNPMSYSEVADPAGGSFARTECVKDNVTGLVWEGKEASGLRAGSNTYTHYDDLTQPQRLDPSLGFVNPTQAEIGAITNSVGYVGHVNTIALCGFANWRLPTEEELQSIVDYSVARPGPTVRADWFPNAASNTHWTSRPYAGPTTMWIVDFRRGTVLHNGLRFAPVPIRLVRSDS